MKMQQVSHRSLFYPFSPLSGQLLCLKCSSSLELSFQLQTQIINFCLDVGPLSVAHPGISSNLNLTFMNIYN